MRGGWHGPMGSVGGITRTYGLQNHFEKPVQDGPAPRIRRANLKRIVSYFKPYWTRWAVIFLCIALTSGLNVLPPFCVGQILDHAIPQGDSGLLALLAWAMVGLAVLSGLLGVLQHALTARAGESIMFDLRNDLYRHMQELSLHFYVSTRSGEIVSRINNDVNAVQSIAANTLVTVAGNLAALLATSIALFTMHWKLALIAVAIVPAFYLPSKIVGAIRRRLSGEIQDSHASLLAFLHERLHAGGSILTKVFGQRAPDAQAFREKSEHLRELNVRQAVVGRWLFMILSVFSAAGPALVFWYGGYQVMQEQLTPGSLIAFVALLTLLYRPLLQLATLYADLQASIAVFDRIFEYLDLEPGVKDRPAATVLERTRGHLTFEGVGFSYPQRQRPPVEEQRPAPEGELPAAFALQEVSFEIQPGQRVALVGPSGAGKTTLTYLAPRFYDPAAGRIRLDGHDLRELSQESLRRHIGMVTQETFLFHASILENLRYAKPDATLEEVEAACRAANIQEFIAGLPEGQHTVVGERGFRLSGGEKQRVSIARALLKDPAILILDEATSSLDATSERLIQEALEKLLHGRTSLIIAHRLSTILSSDLIVVLDKGRVAETGRHEALIEHGGLYAGLFEQQFGKVLEADAGRKAGRGWEGGESMA